MFDGLRKLVTSKKRSCHSLSMHSYSPLIEKDQPTHHRDTANTKRQNQEKNQ